MGVRKPLLSLATVARSLEHDGYQVSFVLEDGRLSLGTVPLDPQPLTNSTQDQFLVESRNRSSGRVIYPRFARRV